MSKRIKRDGQVYVFLSKGGVEVTDEEIEEYFAKFEELDKKEQFIPDTKERRAMFIKDLRRGLKFCADKYGVTTEEIKREARRVVPHININE